MDIFAVALTLCTFSSCNVYYVDQSEQMADCPLLMEAESFNMHRVWNDEKGLTAYLKKFNIDEPVDNILSYEFTCETLIANNIP